MQQQAPDPSVAFVADVGLSQPVIFYNTINMNSNQQTAMYTRIFASLISGCAAGILGVTGIKGFFLFAIFQLVNAVLLFVKSGFRPSKYFLSWPSMFFSGLLSQTEILTFILFWTLSNNLVYLF